MSPPSAHDIATALRQRQPGMPVKKLHKLLYYCQGHHLAAFGEPLFGEHLEAWDMGPVVADLWRAEKHGSLPPPAQQLGEAELNTICYVLSRYGELTGRDLENLSHGEDPWLIADQGRSPGASARIDPEVITRYFRDHGEEEDDLDPDVVSAWLRDSAAARLPGPGRVDSMTALRAKRHAIATRLAPGG
ncbi:MAG: Panacea domain-containing protein [Pseudonocardiaceae bacterium]